MKQPKRIGLACLVAGIACWVVPIAQAQKQDQPIRVRVEVTDSQGRYVKGLQPADFRVLEDGITQKISSFAEGANPPLLVDPNAGGDDAKSGDREFLSGDDYYTVTYYPDPSNNNTGFRRIEVQIVPDLVKFRVRHKQGYRPGR